MKRIIFLSFIFLVCINIILIDPLKSNEKNLPMQSNVIQGAYDPTINITITEMRNLPIPASSENYSFLQCIDMECNVVIGRFASGEREVILIKDKDVDGTVDIVAHWFVDRERFKFDANPGGAYPPEVFKKLKEDIIKGSGVDVYPNSEGLEYIQVLSQNSSNIHKWKTGYSVIKFDPDATTKEMIVYSFSNSTDGADLVFDVKYRNMSSMKLIPVINQCVYCKNSKDKVIIEITQKLIEEAKKASPD